MLTRAPLMVLAVVVCVAAGFVIGWLLDGVAESRPLLTLFLTLVGLVLGVAISWSHLRQSPRSADR